MGLMECKRIASVVDHQSGIVEWCNKDICPAMYMDPRNNSKSWDSSCTRQGQVQIERQPVHERNDNPDVRIGKAACLQAAFPNMRLITNIARNAKVELLKDEGWSIHSIKEIDDERWDNNWAIFLLE